VTYSSRDLIDSAIKFRKMNKLSQSEVARRMGTSQSAISEIESGLTKSPRIETFLRYVDACDASVMVFLYSKIFEDQAPQLIGPGREQERQAESEQATG